MYKYNGNISTEVRFNSVHCVLFSIRKLDIGNKFNKKKKQVLHYCYFLNFVLIYTLELNVNHTGFFRIRKI